MELDIVLYRDPATIGDYWVAHCVQLDLVSSRAEPDDAWADSMRQCAAQVAYAEKHHLESSLFRACPSDLIERIVTARRGTIAPKYAVLGKITFNRVFLT